MGCWNKTCGPSNLPILHGEWTYVFVMEQVNSVDSHCYSTHLYRPVLLPFETTYDDYGGGEDSSGIGFGLIMAGIRERLVELPVVENTIHDIAVTRDAFDESLFFESVHEGRLLVAGRDKPNRVEYTMMRKDVVDTILDTYVIEKYVGDNQGTTGHHNSYIHYRFADIAAEIPDLVAALKERFAGNYDMMRNLGETIIIPRGFEFKYLRDWMGDDSYRYSRLARIVTFLAMLLQDGNEQRAAELLTEHLKARFINYFMEITRKSWIPQSGEGSQDQDLAPYRVLMAAMGQVIKKHENPDDEE